MTDPCMPCSTDRYQSVSSKAESMNGICEALLGDEVGALGSPRQTAGLVYGKYTRLRRVLIVPMVTYYVWYSMPWSSGVDCVRG